MATTTTNFGWDIPQSTDLVKDGATAIAALGQDIDTSLLDLKGGTTGQILSKASAADLDYTWINNDVGDITGVTAGTGLSGGGTSGTVTVSIDTATTVDKTTAQTLTNKTLTSPVLTTPNISTYTTSGDLVYGTGSGAISRLGIGSTNQVLTVSGGAPAWATPATATSGMTLISRTSFSGSSAVNLDNVFTSTYSNYRILIYCLSSNNYDFFMRMRASSTDNTTAKYSFQTISAKSTTISGARTSSSTSWSIGELDTTYGCTTIDIFSPQENTQTNLFTKCEYGLETAINYLQRVCGFFNTTQFDGFSIYPALGTITGTVAVYGLAKS